MRYNCRLSAHLFLQGLLFSSQVAFSQADFWVKTNGTPTGTIRDIAVNSLGYIFVTTTSNGVQRSTDLGNTWTSASSGLPGWSIGQIALNSSGHIFVCSDYVYRSTDNGTSWVRCDAGWTNQSPYSLAINSAGQIFAGTNGGWGIYTSVNNGSSWILTGLSNVNVIVSSIAFNSLGHVFAGTSQGMYRSTDNGNTWSQVNLGLPANTTVFSAAINRSGHIFCSISYQANNQPNFGIFRSTNNGNSWVFVGITNTDTQDLTVSPDGDIFAATFGSGVYRSTDNGASWSQVNSGLSSLDTRAFAFHPDGFLFLATWYGGVFHSTFPVSDVQRVDNSIPGSLTLLPNYPNPFNPRTTIRFLIPTESDVSVKVLNLLGQQVATLFEGRLASGSYTTAWDASRFGSGTYLCNLQAVTSTPPIRTSTQTMKMLLIR